MTGPANPIDTPNGQHTGPTADEIAGLVSAERTAGEYVPVPSPADTADERITPEPVLPLSGNAAIAAAEERAAVTGGRNIAEVPRCPFPRIPPTFDPAPRCTWPAWRCCR